MTPRQPQRYRKMGIVCSIAFIAIGIYPFIYSAVTDEKIHTVEHVTSLSSFPDWLQPLLILFIFITMTIMMIYEDRRYWKGWAALFGAPALGALARLLPLSEGGMGLAIQMVTIFLPIYSLVIFWKTRKNSLQT